MKERPQTLGPQQRLKRIRAIDRMYCVQRCEPLPGVPSFALPHQVGGEEPALCPRNRLVPPASTFHNELF